MKNIKVYTCNKCMEGYIRHEYPKNGKFHPFDINSNLQHFLFAGGFTYLMNINETKQIPEIKKVLPKFYMPFTICERWLMIVNGDIVWENKNISKENMYKILAFYKEEINKNNYSHEIPSIGNFEDDVKMLKEKSKKSNNKNIYMLVKIL